MGIGSLRFQRLRGGLMWTLAALPLWQACADNGPAFVGEADVGGGNAGAFAGEADAVSRAQAYLKRYGYLPSESLREQYPHIRFFVEEEAEDGVLDEPTIQALQHYQERNELEPTGLPDEPTLEAMGHARCGHPDAPTRPLAQTHDAEGDLPEEGLQDKFAIKTTDMGTKRTASIRVLWYPSTDTNLRGLIDADIDRAAREFSRFTGFEFYRTTSGSPDIEVYFYRNNQGPEGCVDFTDSSNLAVMVMSHRIDNNRLVWPAKLCVNRGQAFSFGTAPNPSTTYDFESVLLHELGHAANLGHSSIQGAVMWSQMGRGSTKTSLVIDDLHALWAQYGSWVFSYGGPGIRDMVWSRLNVLWAISERPAGAGGYEIWRRTSANRNQFGEITGPWERVSGAAERIAHDGRRAWVVNAHGTLYLRNDADTAWQSSLSCVRDFDGIADEMLWGWVDCNGRVFVQAGIFTLELPGVTTAQRIGINKRNFDIWVTAGSRVFRYRPQDGAFTRMPGGWFAHIDAAWDGSIWAADATGRLYLWNEQSSRHNTPHRAEWVRFPGTGHVIAGPAWGKPTMARLDNRVSDIKDRFVW